LSSFRFWVHVIHNSDEQALYFSIQGIEFKKYLTEQSQGQNYWPGK
jgi:hypothetical protein